MPERSHRVRRLTRWQRIGAASLFVVGAMVIGGVVFVLSGIYNIGASREHWSATNFILTILRDRSIAVAAGGIKVPDLEDSDLYLLGGEHYRVGCATCHGTPGQELNPIYRNMLPRPPDLNGAFADYNASELFWIVKNGLKYTGMPAWPGEWRSDEVWSVVAYLKLLHLQELKLSDDIAEQSMSSLPPPRSDAINGCVRCHGDEHTGPISALVPRLQGLSSTYLERSLLTYRDELRESGIMEPIVHAMSNSEISSLAGYYAALSPLPPASIVDLELIKRGRQIAEGGVPEEDVPACNSCHNGINSNMPSLAAQSERYMANQLQLWRDGDYRSDTAYSILMAVVGKRLSAESARAVSAYYASLPAARSAP